MKNLSMFLYEWKHFTRSPFKVIAVFLFVLAGIYGLHNGANLYEKQIAEIEGINQQVQEQKASILACYENGQKSPEGRPWVDLTAPYWAISNVPVYAFKTPSSALVYSIGQAEQYGYYKQISVWSSPYDADMAAEISNPERLQTGTLDFAFTVLFLLPLLLLVLTYDLKSVEAEQGFLPLIYVQTASGHTWLLSRTLFYVGLLSLVICALIGYGAMLTGVLANSVDAFLQMLCYSLLYLSFWGAVYFFIIKRGTHVLGNALQMVGFWLLVTLLIPALVHQLVSISKPVNLMTDLIDAKQDGREEIFAQPDTVVDQQLMALFPSIKTSKAAQDSDKKAMARNFSASALVNDLMKSNIDAIEQENQSKNAIIQRTYWFNPLTFFQNKFNAIAQTHYQDYEAFRADIQSLTDKRIGIMVADVWNDVTVDTEKYLAYSTQLTKK